MGWSRRMAAMASGCSLAMVAFMGVSITPGQTALMRMPRAA